MYSSTTQNVHDALPTSVKQGASVCCAGCHAVVRDAGHRHPKSKRHIQRSLLSSNTADAHRPVLELEIALGLDGYKVSNIPAMSLTVELKLGGGGDWSVRETAGEGLGLGFAMTHEFSVFVSDAGTNKEFLAVCANVYVTVGLTNYVNYSTDVAVTSALAEADIGHWVWDSLSVRFVTDMFPQCCAKHTPCKVTCDGYERFRYNVRVYG